MIDEYEAHDVKSSGGEIFPLPPPDHLEAAHKCSDCGKSLENETTIYLHLGKLYCSRCYHAEAGS